MPTYRYTGTYPKHLHGLTHGANAQHKPANGEDPQPGTITAHLGDTITTAEPYEHPDLKPVRTRQTGGPDEERMTAEGAPAPTGQDQE